MPHGGYHGNIKGLGQSGSTQGPAGMGSAPNSNNKPKTDTRPTGMPSFLSSSKPKKSFSQMTSQERTDRFNKNQDKYKQDFKQKIDPIRKPEIPDGSRPKTSEQQSIDDRKLYRQYQDPKVIKATEKAKYTQLEEERRGELGYFPRVGNVNTYFTELAKNAKKTYIQPDASWWEKTLKINAINAWYSTGATALGAMEGALGLTLDPVADFVATTVANGNDIWRAANGLPFDAKIKNDVATEVQEHVVGSLMAYWESTGFGAMRTVTGKVPTMFQTANFIKAKVPFEFKNSIKVFNAMKQKKAKAINPFNAKNKVVQADFKMVSEAAVKNPEVKKEIKQLAIQSWEQASVKKYGPIMANNIANHLRQVNKIMPVQAQSLSAAATPKTDIYKLGEPFYNPIVQQVNSLPVNEAGQIQVKNLTESLSTKKFERPMVISNFNTFLSNLKESNVTMINKKTVDNYLKDNPIELTIDIGTSNVPTQLVEEKKFIENSMIGNIGMLQNISTKVSESLPVELTVADIPANMVIEFPSGSSNIGYLNTAHAATGNRLFEEIANTQLQQMKELNYFNPNMLDDFYEGKINLLDAVPYDGFNVNIPPSTTELDSQLFEIDISNNNVAQGFKDKIMYSIGYAPHYDTNINYQILNDFSSNGKIRTAYIPIKKSAEANAIGEQWVSQLLTNFNNRDHFNADTGEYQSSVPEFMLSVPNTKSLTLDVKLPNYGTLQNLKELANPKNILNQDALMDLTSNNRLVGEYYKEANSNALVNDDYYANQRILQSFLYQLVERLELRDLPGWAPYINKLTQPPDFSKMAPQERRLYVAQTTTGMTTIGNWQYHLNNLKNKYVNFNNVNKKIEVAEKEKIVDTKRPYITTPVDPKGYEFANNVLTFDKHPHGKYMEVKLTSNDLSGYPEFGDEHFRNTKNLLGWSIVTDRRVNISPINPKGERAYVIEEIQPTRPDATMSSNKENAIEGTFLFGSMTKKGLGKPDWYKKKLWADIRVAYDNGFDYLIIPTTKSIKSKTGSGGFYDELPNVAKKFGFDTIKNVDMVDYGFEAPPSVIEQRLREKEDTQTSADEVLEDGPYGRDEINYEFLNENYGDHRFHIIDIRDRNKVFDILNKPQPVASLVDQTNQLLSTFV